MIFPQTILLIFPQAWPVHKMDGDSLMRRYKLEIFNNAWTIFYYTSFELCPENSYAFLPILFLTELLSK